MVTSDMEDVKRILRELADANGSVLLERDVVEHARDPASPLHRYFEWDPAVAHEKYLLHQAAQLIRRVKFEIVRVEKREGSDAISLKITRGSAYPSRASQRRSGEGSRNPLDVILSDPDKRADLLRTALAELRALQRKYENLLELSAVWDAVDAVAALAERDNGGPSR